MSQPRSPIDRTVPQDLQERAAPLEREAWIHLRMGRYQRAQELYERELQLFTERQERERRTIHKGGPLHQRALSLYLQNRFEDAVRGFLLAYCEDALSAQLNAEDNIDRAPACNVLRDRFRIDLTFLGRLKTIARETKQRNEVPGDPAELIRQAITPREIEEFHFLSLCEIAEEQLGREPLDPVLALWPRKVFIGGAFTDPARLRDIQEIVMRLGYEPVLTKEFGVDENLVYHHSLMLLHTCAYAIFEVSRPAGQLIEIERTRDYGIEPLLLYSGEDIQQLDELPRHITAMLRTAGYQIRGYRDTTELAERITDYLTRNTS